MKNVLSKVALAALAASGVAGVGGVAQAQTTPTIQPMSGAPEIRDGEQRFKIRGRFQYDVYSNDWELDDPTDSPAINGEDGSRSYVRRAFLGAQGRLTDNWRYKVDFVLNPGAGVDDAATGDAAVAVDDAYLEYAGDFFSVVIGENNITSPLEDRTSSLDIPFIERSSIINTYGYGRAAGVAGLITGANWMAAVGVYGDSLNNSDASFAADEQFSVSGRFTWAPIFETSPDGVTLLHLGVSARARASGDDGGATQEAFRYRVRPLNGRGSRWVEASSTALMETDTSYGFEVAGQWNAFGFTAEYITLTGESSNDAPVQEIESDGYYVDLYWSLTGESRAYRGNQGSFGPIVPANPVSEGGWGHWDISARYDFIDLDDVDVGGARGEQTAYAVAVNWVPVDHVRFMLNYASTEADRTAGTATAGDAEANVITLRTQFDF
jgi:phosphate-selective porin OprO/OprP